MSKFLKVLIIGGPADGRVWQEMFKSTTGKPSKSIIDIVPPAYNEPQSFVGTKPAPADERRRITYYLYNIRRNGHSFWCYANFISFDALGEWTQDMIYHRLHKFYFDEGML